MGPVVQRTQGQRLEPPTPGGRAHGYFSFLSSVPWTLTQNTQEGREGLSPRPPGEGHRAPGQRETWHGWCLPFPGPWSPQTTCPPGLRPLLSGTWSICVCSLAGGLGAATWAPGSGGHHHHVRPPPNHSDCGTHPMGVLPRGRALPTSLQTLGKQSVRKSHFRLRLADAHSRWPQPPRPATSDAPQCHLGDAQLHGALGSAPPPLLG